MEAGVAPVPWTPRTTVRWLLGGLLLAIIVPPLLVAPFDPDLKGDGALLAAQAMFDGLLLLVALGVASDWKFRPLGRPLRLLGLRPFRLSAIWIMLATLVAYYIAAGLRTRWSLWPAAITSGLIFGSVHAPTGITTVVPLAVLGFALCWLYDRTGSLWPCVIAHMINNGLALAVVS